MFSGEAWREGAEKFNMATYMKKVCREERIV